MSEEEKKISRLDKRLVVNVDFDDQALNSLGFGTDIYYMLGHLFSNGVSANPQGICLGNSNDHGTHP
jgi:hypothetical protein